MFPALATLNIANMALANAKHGGELSLGKRGGSNLFNLRVRKFCTLSISAFLNHVAHVFSVRAHAKVGWIAAGRIVTGVHDFHAPWDHLAMLQNPRNSVSHVHFASVVDAKEALADFVFRRHPRPAFGGREFFDLGPKPFFEFLVKHQVYIHDEDEGIQAA